MSLPGDELFLHPSWGYTHAVTIQAAPETIWPWLVQIGQGRGGFYSYEVLENLVGCNIRNLERIKPELQNLQVGDEIKLHPKAPGIPVEDLEANGYLLLAGRMDAATGGPAAPDTPANRVIGTTWLFYLQPQDANHTRLIVRGHYAYRPTWLNRAFMGPGLLEPISFVMERKMLLTLKHLAETI